MAFFTAARKPGLQIARASTICPRCGHRGLSSSAVSFSGHNRWSKIRESKGTADKKKSVQRTLFSKNLTLYSKMYGTDINLNPQLATLIATAKKAGLPKANIDAAVARGQGRSMTGAQLETATLEVMMPPAVAFIIEIEADNRMRPLNDLKNLVKKYGGNPASTAFFFTRRGRSTLKAQVQQGKDFDDTLMQALEAGADDVEQDEDGNVIVWTQPNMTHQVARGLSSAMGTEILESDIVWTPSSDLVRIDDQEAARNLGGFLAAVRDHADVQAVYANAEKGDVSEEVWAAIEDNLDV